MSKVKFEIYQGEEITKEVLDSVKCGDSVKINEWGKWHKVNGVTENRFVVTCNMFGKHYYSVIEKFINTTSEHGRMKIGSFHCGTSKSIAAYPNHIKTIQYVGVDFSIEENAIEYLKLFELERFENYQLELSPRNTVAIDTILIKRGK